MPVGEDSGKCEKKKKKKNSFDSFLTCHFALLSKKFLEVVTLDVTIRCA